MGGRKGTIKTNDPRAPYGYTLEGKVRKKPGAKKGSKRGKGTRSK